MAQQTRGPEVPLPVGEDAEDALGDLLPGLFSFAAALCGDRGLAEDAVIEATSRALPHVRARRVADPGAYLRRAVVNDLAGRGRRRQLERLKGRHGAVLSARDRPAGERSVDDRLELLPHLRALPMRQRAVLVLRYLEDRSVEEVASILDITTGSVKTHTSRGLARLRDLLEADHG